MGFSSVDDCREFFFFCLINIQFTFTFIEGNLGWLYGELKIASEVLVWLQSNALLLDTGRASTFCYFGMKAIYIEVIAWALNNFHSS